MARTDWAGLEVFLAVVRAGSLRGAAAALNVQPPAVSQRLKQFEDSLGVTLIQRTTRSLSLTEYGEILLRGGTQATGRLDAVLDEVRGRANTPSGPLRVTLPRIVHDHILGQRLWAFQRAYPAISLELIVEDAFTDIVALGIDAGIRIQDAIQEDMVAVRLGPPLPEAVFASPDYLDRNGRPEAPEDLLDHTCIRYRFGRSGTLAPFAFETRAGRRVVDPRGGPVVNDPNALRAAALAGVGIGYLLRPLVEADIEDGGLVSLFDELCPSVPGLFLYYPTGAARAQRLRVIIDFLKVAAVRAVK
ncbi:LysR family transcriptional regulator [Actibacterium sp. 188UL27-1]|uniref:LysR family transcriptional regulator n=1 Tax=Actibacterium sp. 188UL27-1 TaxID=2786961 RepID=UPI001956362D|nr:LysR family transcriptional regulator [Actibacterium sp. 188UL27-1]MBM7067550.1 LysR family transcriptional regulator [Actibacterium sp. 188UL27-1]